jgi:hypothetical protein
MMDWNCSSWPNDLNELNELKDELIFDCLEVFFGLIMQSKKKEMIIK